MVENLIREIKERGCLQWGEEDGETPPSRDILFYRSDRDQIYSITVATNKYLDYARSHNSQLDDPDLKLDENVFILDDISDLKEVCNALTSLPFDKLEPFVSPQNTLETITGSSNDNNPTDIDSFEVK